MTTSVDVELAEFVSQFYADPLGFAIACFPWGEPGLLENYSGPDKWQAELLKEIGEEVKKRKFDGVNAVPAIRVAVASGHGIGKSVFCALITMWILSTRPNCRGCITANTYTQLATKTWATVQKWAKLCITSHWFDIGSDKIRSKASPETWFVSAVASNPDNSEGFAGQHAADSTSFFIFDEASAIDNRIWEVAEGGTATGEPHFYAFGNPTRSSGRFYQACFGNEQHRWNHRSIDSRDAAMTNKTQIAEWESTYGSDSDFFRVRVLGLPPAASELQFIDSTRVLAAQKREVETLPDEPLIAGMDVSGGGSAWNVIRFRCGNDARSIPPVRISGEAGRDRSVLIAAAAEVLRGTYNGRKVAALFVDSAFGAPIVERLHTLGFDHAIEVNFGGPSADHHMLNQRAFMWSRMKDWLQHGAIDSDSKLEIGLSGPGYHINRQNKLVLESKQDMAKRGEASPDDADALALTWAQPVAPPRVEEPLEIYGGPGSWMA